MFKKIYETENSRCVLIKIKTHFQLEFWKEIILEMREYEREQNQNNSHNLHKNNNIINYFLYTSSITDVVRELGGSHGIPLIPFLCSIICG